MGGGGVRRVPAGARHLLRGTLGAQPGGGVESRCPACRRRQRVHCQAWPGLGVRVGQRPPTFFPGFLGLPGSGTAVWTHNSCAALLEPQLGSSVWGLARPLPLPLSPRQGGFLLVPLQPETPSDPPLQQGLVWVLGIGRQHKRLGGRTLRSPCLSPQRSKEKGRTLRATAAVH